MRTLLILAGVLALTLLAPAAARADISDADLAERVVDVISRYGQFGIFDDININVDKRVVRLTGRVTAPNKRDEIGKRVAKIDGIRTFINDIQVLPLSRFDADIRVRVAQAIYNHPAFWRYAQQAQPSIHIIVENGHITLTGLVDSQLDRSLAFALAQVRGAFEVRNELKVSR